MIADVGDETVMVFGIPLPEVVAPTSSSSTSPTTTARCPTSPCRCSSASVDHDRARRAARRLRRPARRAPVAEAAQAAKAIAGGHLGTRLPPTEDPDLGVLASSFNDMASALQLRIERDARFASDVSHELRSPLMTLSASVEVMEARRHELPERAQAALDLLTSDVSRFQGLVEDLLEISRFDAGAIRLHLEDLQVAQFVRNAVAVSSAPSTPVTTTPRAERAVIRGDRRRLARVIANLIDNAKAYGGGEPEITITDANLPDEPLTHVQIGVEDHGPGVPVEERALIFERFARGVSAGRRGGSEGAGLGLALVDEHVRMHGGRVWVEDRIDGTTGARFVIELLATEERSRRRGDLRMRRGALVVAVAGAVVATPACAIQPDTEPRDIPAGDRLELDPVEPEAAGENEGVEPGLPAERRRRRRRAATALQLRDVPGTPRPCWTSCSTAPTRRSSRPDSARPCRTTSRSSRRDPSPAR